MICEVINAYLPAAAGGGAAFSHDYTSDTLPVAITGGSFSSWWSGSVGTFYVNFNPSSTSGSPMVLQPSDGTGNNRISVQIIGGHLYVSIVTVGNFEASVDLGAVSTSTNYKLGFAFAANDFAAVLNAGTPGTDSSVSLPTLSQMDVGSGVSGANGFSGTIGLVEFWAQRDSNALLQSKTT